MNEGTIPVVIGELSRRLTLHPFLAPEERPAGPPPGQVPFQAHVELLQFFLAHRDDIVERIQGLLNAQRKPIEYLQDGSLLSRHFEDCFFNSLGSPTASRVFEVNWKTRIGQVDSGPRNFLDCITAWSIRRR